MATTGHGPASTTVTRSRRPSSWKTWVIPTLRPRSAGIRLPCPGWALAKLAEIWQGDPSPSNQLDLDVHTGRQVVEPLERVDRLRRRLEDVDQPLVRADLEVLARVLVLERGADHAVDVLLRRQRHRSGDRRAGTGRRLDDLLRRRLDGRVVVGLQADADLV